MENDIFNIDMATGQITQISIKEYIPLGLGNFKGSTGRPVHVTETETGCWIPNRTILINGYVHYWCGKTGKSKMMHIAVFVAVNGEIAKGHQGHHQCHNPSCCNPSHLVIKSEAEHAELHHADRHAGQLKSAAKGKSTRAKQIYMDEYSRGIDTSYNILSDLVDFKTQSLMACQVKVWRKEAAALYGEIVRKSSKSDIVRAFLAEIKRTGQIITNKILCAQCQISQPQSHKLLKEAGF